MRSDAGQNRCLSLALIMAFLCAAPVMNGPTAFAEEGRPAARGEYEVKAAFVYNFVKFVEWPATRGESSDHVRLCVLGGPPDGTAFANLAGAFVREKKVAVFDLKERGEVRSCDVLFVAASQTGRLEAIIASLEDRPVLTVGDTEGYARRGIMINMFLENKRVRFEINEKKARAAGILISAKLLKLASTVYVAAQKEEQ